MIIKIMKTKENFICDDVINITSYVSTRYNLESGAHEDAIAALLKKLFNHNFKYKNILFLLCTEHPRKKNRWHYYFAHTSPQKLEIEYLFEHNKQLNVFDLVSFILTPNSRFATDQRKHIKLNDLLNLPDWDQILAELFKQAEKVQIEEYFFDAERRFYQTAKNKLESHHLYKHYKTVLTNFRLGGSMTCTFKDDQYHWPHIYYLANQAIEDREDLIFDIDYLGRAIPFDTKFESIYENLSLASLNASLDVSPFLRSELFEIDSRIQWRKKTQL